MEKLKSILNYQYALITLILLRQHGKKNKSQLGDLLNLKNTSSISRGSVVLEGLSLIETKFDPAFNAKWMWLSPKGEKIADMALKILESLSDQPSETP